MRQVNEPVTDICATPIWVTKLLERWYRTECAIAVIAYSLIAIVLIADVMGREILGPIFRSLEIKGQAGVYGAAKMSVYSLVVASFIGIGIATASGSHLRPRVGFSWIPTRWGPSMDRLADFVSGGFMFGLAWYGSVYVYSIFESGLRSPAFDIPLWPMQATIPLGFLSAGLRYLAFCRWPALRPIPSEVQE